MMDTEHCGCHHVEAGGAGQRSLPSGPQLPLKFELRTRAPAPGLRAGSVPLLPAGPSCLKPSSFAFSQHSPALSLSRVVGWRPGTWLIRDRRCP